MELVKYIDDLARKNSEALSFIPYPKLEAYYDKGQVLIATENNDPCGFLIFGNNFPVIKIYQACIQYDARNQHHGINLVKRLIKKALQRNCVAISLYCADDLEANEFWKNAGFVFSGQKLGGNRRGRKHNYWVMMIGGLLMNKEVNSDHVAGLGDPSNPDSPGG